MFQRSMVSAAVLVVALLAAAPAHASFPGKQGRIAFQWDPNGMAAPEPEIAAINPDGSGFAPLTTNGAAQFDSLPGYSADGARLLFGQFNSGSLDFQILIANADGSGQDGLLTSLGPAYDPAFAPDGNSFAYVCDTGAGTAICARQTSGAALPALADKLGDDLEPAYARDGRLFFSNDNGGDKEIFVRAPSGAVTQLTSNPSDEEEPNPSPDGKLVAFVGGPTGGDIVVMHSNGTSPVNLTSTAAAESNPSFSPDGKLIAFERGGALFAMPTAGGAATPLTNLPSDLSGAPDWQPIPVKCGGRRATQVGTAGRDVLVGTSGPDVLAGLGGRDTLKGKKGNDVLCGGAGRDALSAGKGKKDRCIGGKGADTGRACEKAKSL
jgi:Tol biopolymer transport system component